MARSGASSCAPAEVKACLTAIGAISTIAYEDADCLIFSSDCFSGVMKIKYSNDVRITEIDHGSAWSSGETISSPTIVYREDNAGNYSFQEFGCCRVPGKVLALNILYIANLMTYPCVAVLGKLESGDTYCFGCGPKAPTGMVGFKNITDNVSYNPIYPASQVLPIITSGGNLYLTDLKYTLNGVPQTDNLQNIKILCRASSITTGMALAYGDDVVLLTGNGTAGSVTVKLIGCDLVVIDGNI